MSPGQPRQPPKDQDDMKTASLIASLSANDVRIARVDTLHNVAYRLEGAKTRQAMNRAAMQCALDLGCYPVFANDDAAQTNRVNAKIENIQRALMGVVSTNRRDSARGWCLHAARTARLIIQDLDPTATAGDPALTPAA